MSLCKWDRGGDDKWEDYMGYKMGENTGSETKRVEKWDNQKVLYKKKDVDGVTIALSSLEQSQWKLAK